MGKEKETEEYIQANYWIAYNKIWTRAYNAGAKSTEDVVNAAFKEFFKQLGVK